MNIDSNGKDMNLEFNKNITIIGNRTLWRPMKLVQGYLLIVFILFAFGPWPWPIIDKMLVNIYIISAQLLLIFGYSLSIKNKDAILIANSFENDTRKETDINKIIRIILIISVILFIPTYMARVGINSFNLGMFAEAFVDGLLDPGKQYYYKLSIQSQMPTNIILLLVIAITSPFCWLLVPLTIVYWDKVKFKYKLGAMIIFLLDIISWISIGTNKGVFDNVFIISFSLLIKVCLENKTIKISISAVKSKLKLIIFLTGSISAAIIYLINSIKSRLGRLNYYYKAADIYVNKDSLIMQIIPDFLNDIVIVVTSYTTQGYYGLSLAMREDFTPTFGFGSSWFLLNLHEKITGDTALRLYTYPFKLIKYGWDPYINWHSIYAWLASDFSFVGTLLLMVLIGYLFGEVWKSILFKQNVFAMGLFVLLMIMFMYFPANNQIFAYTHTFSAFWGLFAFWMFTYKIKQYKWGRYHGNR